MATGYLDGVKTSGYIEGWAFNKSTPARPCKIRICVDGGQEIASGLAHRYREDLAFDGIGMGWCGFRLRTSSSAELMRNTAVILYDRVSGAELHRADSLPVEDDASPSVGTTEDVKNDDPTILRDISQLRGCDELFNTFIQNRGVGVFVRTAYVYILGRCADEGGQALYGQMIRRAAMSPYGVLAALADSDEFRSHSRSFSAPNQPAFPFRCD